MYALLKTKNFYFVIYIFIGILILINNNLQADQEFRIISNELNFNKEEDTINAEGNVLILGEKISTKAD